MRRNKTKVAHYIRRNINDPKVYTHHWLLLFIFYADLIPQRTYFVSSRNSHHETNTKLCQETNGFFVIPGTGCRRYYFCIGGSRTDLNCSGNFLFNGELCVDPTQFNCQESHPSSEPRELLNHRNDDPCAGTKKSGLYPITGTSDCRGFVYCRQGKQQGGMDQCSESQRFSGEKSRCLPKHQVLCGSTEDQSIEVETWWKFRDKNITSSLVFVSAIYILMYILRSIYCHCKTNCLSIRRLNS